MVLSVDRIAAGLTVMSRTHKLCCNLADKFFYLFYCVFVKNILFNCIFCVLKHFSGVILHIFKICIHRACLAKYYGIGRMCVYILLTKFHCIDPMFC